MRAYAVRKEGKVVTCPLCGEEFDPKAHIALEELPDEAAGETYEAVPARCPNCGHEFMAA